SCPAPATGPIGAAARRVRRQSLRRSRWPAVTDRAAEVATTAEAWTSAEASFHATAYAAAFDYDPFDLQLNATRRVAKEPLPRLRLDRDGARIARRSSKARAKSRVCALGADRKIGTGI